MASSVALASSPTPNLYSLSLEELINVEVSTPSKSPQSYSDTPGIVSILSSKEIALFGGADLGEVLSRMPGFEEFGTLLNGRNIVSIRSDQPNVNNSHVLFLLNGVPVNRESYAGGIWNEAIILTIPLESIEQLEIVRGPGSVLYGTNAFAGVVNIITKSLEQTENKLSISIGNNNTRRASITGGIEIDGWQWTSAFRWYESDGWPIETTGTSGFKLKEDAYSKSPGFIASLKKDNFKANLYWGKADQLTIRGSNEAPEPGKTNNEKFSLSLSYNSTFKEKWDLESRFSYVGGRTDHYISSATPGQLNVIHYETNDSRFEVIGRNKPSLNSNLVIGGTIDYFSGKTPPPRVILPSWNNYLIALYAQYEIQLDKTKFIVGAQYNSIDNRDSDLVPRLGVIHHFNEQSGLKILYGEAFRAPYNLERDIDVSIPNLSLKGDKNLQPEHVTTLDLQYFYTSNNLTAAATLFRNEQKDLIIRDPVGPGQLVFANKGRLVIEGVELETKYSKDRWYISGSLTSQRNEDSNGMDDYTLQPHYIIKLGAGYVGKHWSVGIFNSYYSEYQKNILTKPARQLTNPSPDVFHRLSANFNYHNPALKGWEISVYLDNILDESIYVPTQAGDTSLLNTTPTMADRIAMVDLRKKF